MPYRYASCDRRTGEVSPLVDGWDEGADETADDHGKLFAGNSIVSYVDPAALIVDLLTKPAYIHEDGDHDLGQGKTGRKEELKEKERGGCVDFRGSASGVIVSIGPKMVKRRTNGPVDVASIPDGAGVRVDVAVGLAMKGSIRSQETLSTAKIIANTS